MQGQTGGPPPVRFGVFEVDSEAKELRKAGLRVHLQEQPFRILLKLLEVPGKIVSHDELKHVLSPSAEFGDFDHIIRVAVHKLRLAFSDDPHSPRFIETLANQGYRFIYPITVSAPLPAVAITQAPHQPSRKIWIAIIGLVICSALLLWVAWNRVKVRLRPPAPIRSLVVLPLQNLSSDPNQRYFVEGMTDELITAIAQIKDLQVISRTSAMRYRDSSLPIPQIAHELKVDGVVVGTVLGQEGHVRINLQLIEAKTEKQLWADQFEGDTKDVFNLQAEIAQAIAYQISVGNGYKSPFAQSSSSASTDPKALEAYLQGSYELHKFSPGSTANAVAYFQQAIKFDPNFAKAYAGLADAYIYSTFFSTLSPNEAFSKAEAAALKALQLEPSLTVAHASLARIKAQYHRDWKGAERQFQRALELAPNSGDLLWRYAWFLTWMGRFDESQRLAQRALEIDPLNFFVLRAAAMNSLCRRNFDDALHFLQLASRIEPNNALLIGDYGRVYIAQGRNEEAVIEFEKERALLDSDTEAPTSGAGWLGYAYAVTGQTTKAREVLQQLLTQANKSFPAPTAIALVYLGLGQHDRAFQWLNKAVETNEGYVVLLKVFPVWDPLRSDPRFTELLRKAGF